MTFSEPSSLTRIEDRAFCMTNLLDVMIPKSVEYLGDKSFRFCRSLFVFSFEDRSHLKYIGNECFDGCNIRDLVIPPEVVSIGRGGLNGVKCVMVDGRNPKFYSEAERLRGGAKSGSVFFLCSGGRTGSLFLCPGAGVLEERKESVHGPQIYFYRQA